MKWTHFFWDFDGTLFDTYGRITRAFVKGLADTGVRTDFDTALPLVKRSLGYAADWYAARSGAGASLSKEKGVVFSSHSCTSSTEKSTLRRFTREGVPVLKRRSGIFSAYSDLERAVAGNIPSGPLSYETSPM